MYISNIHQKINNSNKILKYLEQKLEQSKTVKFNQYYLNELSILINNYSKYKKELQQLKQKLKHNILNIQNIDDLNNTDHEIVNILINLKKSKTNVRSKRKTKK